MQQRCRHVSWLMDDLLHVLQAASRPITLSCESVQAVQEEALEALHQQQQQQHLQQTLTVTSTLSAQPKGCSSCSGSAAASSGCTLVEKLYKHKLRALLQQQDSTVLRCKACAQLFASASHHKLQCPAGQLPTSRYDEEKPIVVR